MASLSRLTTVTVEVLDGSMTAVIPIPVSMPSGGWPVSVFQTD